MIPAIATPMFEDQQRYIKELKAEQKKLVMELAQQRDELLKDAMRYRWLRDNKHLDIWWSMDGPEDRCENINADIDAAMKGEQKWIAGHILAFRGEDESRCEDLLIELTDPNTEDGKYIEVSFDHGKERVYLQFRLSDLLREVKEQK